MKKLLTLLVVVFGLSGGCGKKDEGGKGPPDNPAPLPTDIPEGSKKPGPTVAPPPPPPAPP